MRAISYGGGVQSTALVVLAGQGKIDFPVALFANVGEKAEHPATLSYVREIAIPWGEANGVAIHELHNRDKDGNILDLYESVTQQGTGNIMIPARMSKTGAPGTRSCTDKYKIQVVRRWLRERGATAQDPAQVAIGISIDEIQRMSTKVYHKDQEKVFPLIDLRLDRADCQNIIRSAGLPVPPKSACFFCPYHRPQVWAEQRRDEPELFAKSEALEEAIITKRQALGRDPMYLTRFGKPLGEAVQEAQSELFPEQVMIRAMKVTAGPRQPCPEVVKGHCAGERAFTLPFPYLHWDIRGLTVLVSVQVPSHLDMTQADTTASPMSEPISTF